MIDLLDEEGVALVHKEGALEDLEHGARPLDLLEDGGPAVGRVNDRVRLVLGVADRDVLGGVGPVAEVGVVEALVVGHELLRADLAEQRTKVALVVADVDRHLLGRALDVALEHERVVELDAHLRVRLGEELGRIAGVVLVERERVADEHRERVLVPPSRPTGLLAKAGQRVREADGDDGVEAADVDAELERRRRDDAEQPAGEHLLLDLAPVLGVVAGPVRHDPRRHVRPPLEHQVGPDLPHHDLADAANLRRQRGAARSTRTLQKTIVRMPRSIR